MEIVQCHTPNKSLKKRLRTNITLGVVHYTGSMNFDGTLNWFENPKAKVSAHYVIGREGTVAQFETIYTKLWHAGKSEWNGRKWCNGYSIGYELVGTSDSGFTQEQYDALCEVIMDNMTNCPLSAIVGHEHISPGRKVDPGEGFNWNKIAAPLAIEINKHTFTGNKLAQIGPKRLKPVPLAVNESGRELDVPEPMVTSTSTEVRNPKMGNGKDPWWKIW